MAFIDSTVVNVALPALQSALHATLADVQWVVEAYALFLAALLLIGGSLGDRYGRRRVFTAGVVVFSAASAWCGLAPNIGQLIVARGVQGVGGALLVPGSLALISTNFSESERGRYRNVVTTSRRSRQRLVRCWADGLPSMVRGDGYSSSICRWGWPSSASRCGKSRKARSSARARRFDWQGRPDDCHWPSVKSSLP